LTIANGTPRAAAPAAPDFRPMAAAMLSSAIDRYWDAEAQARDNDDALQAAMDAFGYRNAATRMPGCEPEINGWHRWLDVAMLERDTARVDLLRAVLATNGADRETLQAVPRRAVPPCSVLVRGHRYIAALMPGVELGKPEDYYCPEDDQMQLVVIPEPEPAPTEVPERRRTPGRKGGVAR
jgi:hypothetical protein